MPDRPKELSKTFIKAVAEISESQSAILELLSAALPDLTAKERTFIKKQSAKAAGRTEIFRAMLGDR